LSEQIFGVGSNARLDKCANRKLSLRQCPAFIAVEPCPLLKDTRCVDDVLEPLHPYDLTAHTPHPRDINFRFGEPIRRDLQYRKIAEHSTPKLVHRPRRAATVRLLAITSRHNAVTTAPCSATTPDGNLVVIDRFT
jgi:hypothetical protein